VFGGDHGATELEPGDDGPQSPPNRKPPLRRSHVRRGRSGKYRSAAIIADQQGNGMSWEIKNGRSPGVIELVYRGLTTGNDLRTATSECISLGNESGTTRFLVDAFEMELAASFVDLFELPQRQYTDEKLTRKSLIAVIRPVSDKSREAAQFYETACQNRGWSVRLFPDRQGALDWLLGVAGSGNPGAGGPERGA